MRNLIPVTIGGIEFDALISESRGLEAAVPEYPVEEGYSVSDNIALSAEVLNMTLYITDTPVTWLKRHGTSPGRTEEVCERLTELYYSRIPVTVSTPNAEYDNMGITSITISRTADDGYAREIPISLKKIRVTSARTAAIPSSYGKSGATMQSAGTAGTSPRTTEAAGTSSESGRKSSILYNLASSIGLIGGKK